MSSDYDQAIIACALAELITRLESTGLAEDAARPRELLAEAEAGNIVVGPDPEFAERLNDVRSTAREERIDPASDVTTMEIVQALADIGAAHRLPEPARTRLAALVVCVQARIDLAAWTEAARALSAAASHQKKH